MDTIRSILTGSLNYLKTIGFADAVDILIVAYLIYKAIELIRKTNSFKLAKGIIVLLLVLWLSGVFKLTMDSGNLILSALSTDIISSRLAGSGVQEDIGTDE